MKCDCTREEAAVAFDSAAIQAGRSICKLNYPKQAPPNYKPKKKKLRRNNTLGYRGVVKKYKFNNTTKQQLYTGQINIDGKCKK